MLTVPRPNSIWNTCLGIVLLLPASLYVMLVIAPFYVYGIDQYSYHDINLQRVPGYPSSSWPVEALIVLMAAFGRPFLLFYTLGLASLLLPGWSELAWSERVVWGTVMCLTLIVTVVMFSPVGSATTTWILD